MHARFLNRTQPLPRQAFHWYLEDLTYRYKLLLDERADATLREFCHAQLRHPDVLRGRDGFAPRTLRDWLRKFEEFYLEDLVSLRAQMAKMTVHPQGQSYRHGWPWQR